jgi:hypothetical protein
MFALARFDGAIIPYATPPYSLFSPYCFPSTLITSPISIQFDSVVLPSFHLDNRFRQHHPGYPLSGFDMASALHSIDDSVQQGVWLDGLGQRAFTGVPIYRSIFQIRDI